MGPKALQFIHSVARKQAAKQSGEGLTSIANVMQAEAKAGEIAETFRLLGIPLEKLDDFIKSEKDVLKYLNIFESSKPVTKEVSKDLIKVPRKKGEVFDLTGKKIDTSKPILGGKNVELTHNEKIDWLVKNVDPNAAQTIPPKPALEAMLRDGREDLIDHFYEMHTKNLGKPKIDIDTSDLKHPELVKKMMTDEKLKPTLVKTEAQIKKELEKQNKESIQRLKDKMKDPEDLAGGGIAGMLGEPTYQDEDHRIPLKFGKRPKGGPLDWWDLIGPEDDDPDVWLDILKSVGAYQGGGRAGYKNGKGPKMSRRGFLKIMGGLAALPVVGKFFKFAKPAAKVADLTSVPIKNADGMPSWFKPLVNRVIKEGDDVTKKFATKEREIVHVKKLDDGDDVYLHQDLDTGSIRVEYQGKGSFGEGPIQLEYKPGEVIPTKKGSVKEKDSFTASEDDYYAQTTSPDGDFDIEFTENIVNKVDDLYSDTSKLKEFATGKKLTIKEISESMEKRNYIKEVDENPNDHAFRNTPEYDGPYDDEIPLASGGRVPFALGKIVKGGNWLIKSLRGTREQLKTMNMSPGQLKYYLDQIDDQIKSLEAGGKIPEEVIQTIRKDPKFKSVWQNKLSADPNLREMEEVLLEYGKKHASGGRVSLSKGGLAGMLGE
jgi:hypothetical protein